MNIFKTIETAFIAATAVAITSAALLMPRAAPVAAPDSAPESALGTAPMHVVVVSAKRLTLEEKLQSLREERQMAMARQQVARG